MRKLKIKKGDEVQILVGKDKGKKSTVLEVKVLKQKIRVKDVRVQTIFDKKNGMQKREGFIDYSNVKLIQKAAKTKKMKKKSKGKLLN